MVPGVIPLVMGVLNVTPDSFSDGGRYLSLDHAVAHGEEMIAEGADIVDVGGESTRPGAEPVSVDVEIARVVPVVEALAGRVRLSVDTRHAEVARAAIAAGATLVNDVSASLWPVAAEAGVGWLAMHMAGVPSTMQDHPHYDDVVAEVRAALLERAMVARDAGVGEVWIDPGFGFGKTLDHNLDLLARLDELVATGFPVCVGTSRKSTLGVLTARADARAEARARASKPAAGAADAPVVADPPDPAANRPPTAVDDRLEASLATATWAMMQGARMIRVHDVRAHRRAALVVAGQIPPKQVAA